MMPLLIFLLEILLIQIQRGLLGNFELQNRFPISIQALYRPLWVLLNGQLNIQQEIIDIYN